jgi:transcriptional regulator with XRE-family HTH domain
MRDRTYKLNAQVIERQREALGMSLNALASKAEVHVKTLKKWLSGKPAFIEKARTLAAALGIPTDHLLTAPRNDLMEQAKSIGVNLLLNVPAGQPDPGGELASFTEFMAKAFHDYSNYLEDSRREPGIAGFADFMRKRREDQRKEEEQKSYEHYDGWKQIRVYFIRSFDEASNERMYCYAIANVTLHDQMMESLNKYGNIPDFAVIVAQGYDDPSEDVKAYMKTYYGFDHDKYATD